MDSVLRAGAVYFFLMVIFRVSGKRALSEVTPFDFVLLLIISEATQQALIGEDSSITTGMLVILTLFTIDIGLSLLTIRSRKLDKILTDVPTVIIEDGRPFDERMKKLRVSLDDVLEQARISQGIERLDQVRFAIVERSGSISIIPAA